MNYEEYSFSTANVDVLPWIPAVWFCLGNENVVNYSYTNWTGVIVSKNHGRANGRSAFIEWKRFLGKIRIKDEQGLTVYCIPVKALESVPPGSGAKAEMREMMHTLFFPGSRLNTWTLVANQWDLILCITTVSWGVH